MKINNPRRDVVTKKSYPREQLLRLVVAEGKLVFDKDMKMPGRGLYVLKDPKAIEGLSPRHLVRIVRIDEVELTALKKELLDGLL